MHKFLVHPDTHSPLSVSVQAPWGGGKTTLMRMLQQRLDPKNPVFSKEDRSVEGSLTCGEVLREVATYRGEDMHVTRESSLEDEERWTVWFNAWKYESDFERMWAGLADAIARQVSSRLSVVDREKFWLKVHMDRIDRGRIRRKIYEHIAARFVQSLLSWGFLTFTVVMTAVACLLRE